MIILTFRTDKPESEIGLYEDGRQISYHSWQAHRALAETIHKKIDQILAEQGKDLSGIDAIVCYRGPGSFTGLRIGLSVANAFAYSLQIPLVGIEGEQDWIEKGLDRLAAGENDTFVTPSYGAPVHITTPKK